MNSCSAETVDDHTVEYPRVYHQVKFVFGHAVYDDIYNSIMIIILCKDKSLLIFIIANCTETISY